MAIVHFPNPIIISNRATMHMFDTNPVRRIQARFTIKPTVRALYFDRSIEDDLNDSLPDYYIDSKDKNAIMYAEAQEIKELNIASVQVLKQLFPSQATWGLYRWENECGIVTELADPIEVRRARVLSLINSNEIMTLERFKFLIEEVSESTVTVEVISSTYTVNVNVRAIGGTSSPLYKQINRLIERILPAHLIYTLNFKANTHGDIQNGTSSFADIQNRSFLDLMTREF